MSLSKLYDIDNLYKALKQVEKSSGWKERTQRYKSNFLTNLTNLSERLQNGEYKPSRPETFISKRGKPRLIESYCIEDRIVQNCFINEILLPAVRPHLIYDNSASLKGRGVDHFRRRLELKLCRFAKENGSNGYILLGDFTKYFDNLLHSNFLEFLRKCGCDEDTIQFTGMLLKQRIIYVEDDTIPFNSIDYFNGINHGNIRLDKTIGVGSPLAQIAGVCGVYWLDNLMSIILGFSCGRYMDDFYAIAQTKEELIAAKELITEETSNEGLFLNPKKTQIVPLSHNFTILHTTYRINKRVLTKRPDKTYFTRERRKLKKLYPKVINGEMTLEQFENRHESWKGSIEKRFNSTLSLNNVELIYNNIKEELSCIQ